MTSSIDKIVLTLRHLLSLFIDSDYHALEKMSQGIRLTAEEMEQAVKEYGATIVMPPSDVLDGLDIIEIDGSYPTAWSLRFDLWTAEEGQSDLSLELTVISNDEDLLKVEIDNIHVL